MNPAMNELDQPLRPMCSRWTISWIGPEKKVSYNHVLHDITGEKTTRWIIKAIKKAGGIILRVEEYKHANVTVDVSSKFGVKRP
jgi:hypothetical protein